MAASQGLFRRRTTDEGGVSDTIGLFQHELFLDHHQTDAHVAVLPRGKELVHYHATVDFCNFNANTCADPWGRLSRTESFKQVPDGISAHTMCPYANDLLIR